MPLRHRTAVALALALAAIGGGTAALPARAATLDLEPFLRRDVFTDIKLSPDGTYFAATVPAEDRTALVVLRRADMKVTATFAMGPNSVVSSFAWTGNTTILASVAEKIGMLANPQELGEIYAIDAAVGRSQILVGQRVESQGAGTKIQPKKVERVAAFIDDTLPGDERMVLVSIWPFSDDPWTRAERLDTSSGRRQQVARAPVRNARFAADNQGVVRFAYGGNADNVQMLYYRADADSEWKVLHDARSQGGAWFPLGFAADDRTAYLRAQRPQGPDVLLALDVAAGTTKEVLSDPVSSPDQVLYDAAGRVPVGALFVGDAPRTRFIDEASPDARLQRSLEAAFAGSSVLVTSRTTDGTLALVRVWSGSNPGDFYLYDTVAKKAAHVVSRREWFDPERMGNVKSIALAARDGKALHGFLTLPPKSDGKRVPLVVMPHGGPIGIQDELSFDDQAQLLALAGYAVLQVNFRGSAGYGEDFKQAGAQQWGAAMQDDVTDATRWAIAQGIADPARICMAGASYGAYASLMGVVREPSLYRCAVGYVGVYDLPMIEQDGKRDGAASTRTWQREWLGTGDTLVAASPTRLADRIKVPVLLVAGGEDTTAPIAHSRKMEVALKAAGVPVETLYVDNEGHGFYTPEHRREYYTRLLAFLSRSLGGATAAPPAMAAKR